MFLGNYEGKRLKSAAGHWKPGESTFLYSLSNGEILYGTSDFKFLNHSCAPNVQAFEHVVNGVLEIGFKTLTVIKQSRELLIDYQLSAGDTDPAQYRCLCSARNCKGTMLASNPL